MKALTPSILLFVVGAGPLPAQEAVPTTAQKLIGGEDRGIRMRFLGTVTYHDPLVRFMIVQDGESPVRVRTPGNEKIYQVGERVEIVGRWDKNVLAVSAAEIRLAGPIEKLDAPMVNDKEFRSGQWDNRFVTIEGIVRSVQSEGSRLVLRVSQGRAIHRVSIQDGFTELGPVENLPDAEVTLKGIVYPTTTNGGMGMTHRFLVQSQHQVVVRRASSENPFEMPETPLADLTNQNRHRVRVHGVFDGRDDRGWGIIRSGDLSVSFEVPAVEYLRKGVRLDVLGFAAMNGKELVLVDTMFRNYEPSRPGKGATGQSAELPVLHSAGQIRRLSTRDANQGFPVRFEGTVLFHDPVIGDLFIHDGHEGVYAYVDDGAERYAAGTHVLIEGYTDAGAFAPCITETRLTLRGPGTLPTPRRTAFQEMFGGRLDSQWVETTAIIRSARRIGEHRAELTLNVMGEVGFADVLDATDGDLAAWRGASVTICGAIGSVFDDRRRWKAVRLFVARPDQITIRKNAPIRPSDMSVRSIRSLTEFNPDHPVPDWIRVRGVVLWTSGNRLIVQDASDGIEVETYEPSDLQPGDGIDVTAQLDPRGERMRLIYARWTRIENVDRVRPEFVAPADVIEENRHFRLIEVVGTLQDILWDSDGGRIMLMHSVAPLGQKVYFAVPLGAAHTDEMLEAIQPGSHLRVRGVSLPCHDSFRIAQFQVLTQHPEDIDVLSRPPWWTPRRARAVLISAVVFAVAALFWTTALRYRVARQTRVISERLKAESALEQKYHRLFDQAADVIFCVSSDRRVTTLNPAGRRLTRLEVGENPRSAVSSEWHDLLDELLSAEQPLTREVEMQGPEKRCWLEITAQPLLENGKQVGIEAIGRDITKRRELEAQVLHSSRIEAIGKLAGGVAHDFNNLLTVINGNAEVLRGQVNGESTEMIAEILLAGKQASNLTRQLLTFSRKDVVAPRVLNPNHVIHGMRNLTARLMGERIQVRTVLDPAVGSIRIDPGQLEQAIINLAVNARDAMPKGGLLSIQSTQVGDTVTVSVRDTGCGIEDAIRMRMFEPFFTTKSAGEGTGLGLATVLQIVERAGGRVTVESEVGSGTLFAMEFPACESQPDPFDSVHRDVSTAGQKRETVLLVEDEPSVQLLQRRVLEMAKFDVLTASSGEEAINLLRNSPQPIDLLLTDVVMPGMNGRELADHVRLIRPDMRTLFMSGYTPDEVLREGVAAEEVDFIQKPFTPSALLAKVREILNRQAV